MDLRPNLEAAIRALSHEFLENPYHFFTEADAVARFHQILSSDPALGTTAKSKDGYWVPLIHQEYPTFFRFDDGNPKERLGTETGASRGHYDVVILNQEFIRAHPAETAKNRSIDAARDNRIRPFEAAFEFKLDDRGWSSGKTQGAIAEMDKLVLSKPEVELSYFISFMRYTAPTLKRWETYWPKIEQAAEKRAGIRSLFITQWISIPTEATIRIFGDWLASEIPSSIGSQRHEAFQRTP